MRRGLSEGKKKDARHLRVDHVPLTGIGHELDIPKIGVVLCENEGNEQEERG